MICTNCHGENISDSVYCAHCGNKIEQSSKKILEEESIDSIQSELIRKCSRCNSMNNATAAECRNCGFAFSGDEEIFYPSTGEVSLINTAGKQRTVKIGFSWTVLFFGGIPFLFRGLYLHGILYHLVLIIGYKFPEPIINIATLLIALLVPFFANKITLKYYLSHGYSPVKNGSWIDAKKTWDIQDN